MQMAQMQAFSPVTGLRFLDCSQGFSCRRAAVSTSLGVSCGTEVLGSLPPFCSPSSVTTQRRAVSLQWCGAGLGSPRWRGLEGLLEDLRAVLLPLEVLFLMAAADLLPILGRCCCKARSEPLVMHNSSKKPRGFNAGNHRIKTGADSDRAHRIMALVARAWTGAGFTGRAPARGGRLRRAERGCYRSWAAAGCGQVQALQPSRGFFDLSDQQDSFRFHETRTVPYTQKQVFDVIVDVERYPQFLPFCICVKKTGARRCATRVLWPHSPAASLNPPPSGPLALMRAWRLASACLPSRICLRSPSTGESAWLLGPKGVLQRVAGAVLRHSHSQLLFVRAPQQPVGACS